MTEPEVIRVLLLRHGQTDDNVKGIVQGQRPVGLNEVGREQARQLGRRLAAEGLEAALIVCSDLPRAAETAQIISHAMGASVVCDPRWRERCLGELEGTIVGVEGIWLAAVGEHTPRGGETLPVFTERIRDALMTLPARYPAARQIVVVAHGGPLRTVLQMLHDGVLPLVAGQRPPEVCNIVNCSIMELEAHPQAEQPGWRLVRLNDAGHLNGSN